jgi:hypothetical protein
VKPSDGLEPSTPPYHRSLEREPRAAQVTETTNLPQTEGIG